MISTESKENIIELPFTLGIIDDAVVHAWQAIEPTVRRAAYRLSDDADSAEDLMQEARIALWEIDPTRFDLRIPREKQYLQRMVTNRMWHASQSEKAAKAPNAEPIDAVITDDAGEEE